ncbi:AraC family transcriptional regulator [Tamlana sp. 2_MG-2023]|uniref:helix-turn-helix transcriptional regulator n=1 Tax=unclassified Tamlana TaxID=2614803 RepID=UPI0026E32A7E|nr:MULTISPECIES: AraC family transcriptional regulator [unclassified Tamlana]MDO6761279.1 AraC family transcriptional regulator [Tamlana sp. 2_MG-2023]MDO6791762.1 AraC family transcriptional regulator [Tamlana sp. 1_MG-2023]
MNDLIANTKLSILHAGSAKLDNLWNYTNVISPFVRLFAVTKGEGNATYKNQTFILKESYMYLIPSHVYNSYKCESFLEQQYVGFFEEVKQGLSVFNLKKFKYEVPTTPQDLALFRRLIAINPNISITDSTPSAHVNSALPSYDKNKSSPINQAIETQGILAILLSRFMENATIFNNLENVKGDFNKVIEYIAQNLHKDISVNQLAQHYHISPDHFSRNFKATYEITPNKYIQLKRIERAQFLLLTTKDALLQIAENVGMPNLSYFSRKFKTYTGYSPGAFRNQQLQTK